MSIQKESELRSLAEHVVTLKGTALCASSKSVAALVRMAEKALEPDTNLSEKLVTLLTYGVKMAGSYQVKHVMPHIEEQLTLEESNQLTAFLNWVVKTKTTFGHNLPEVYARYIARDLAEPVPLVFSATNARRALKKTQKLFRAQVGAKNTAGNAYNELIWKTAHDAGMAAAAKIDIKKIVDGFGYVCVKLGKPSASEFATWYMEREKMDKVNVRMDGVRVTVRNLPDDPYQGFCKKEAYCEAFANVLREHKIPCSVWSRLD